MGVSQWFSFTSKVRVHPSASLRSDLGPRRFKRVTVSAPPTTNAISPLMGVKHGQLCACTDMLLYTVRESGEGNACSRP